VTGGSDCHRHHTVYSTAHTVQHAQRTARTSHSTHIAQHAQRMKGLYACMHALPGPHLCDQYDAWVSTAAPVCEGLVDVEATAAEQQESNSSSSRRRRRVLQG
jgi:hypothetical protein